MDEVLSQTYLRDTVQDLPDMTAVYLSWQFCKLFFTSIPQSGITLLDDMAEIKVPLKLNNTTIKITLRQLWCELDPAWRTEASLL